MGAGLSAGVLHFNQCPAGRGGPAGPMDEVSQALAAAVAGSGCGLLFDGRDDEAEAGVGGGFFVGRDGAAVLGPEELAVFRDGVGP